MKDAVRQAAMTLWRYHCLYEPVVSADVIVGLGSYDLRVAEHCAALFHDGIAPRLVFSGAVGNWTAGRFEGSEARAFADRATTLGVPEAAITLEERSTNIGENVQRSAEVVGDERAKWVFVTKPQTQRRCRAAIDVYLAGATTCVTAPEHDFDAQPLPHHDLAALIDEMVGDMARIIEYPVLGYQSEQPVPDDVLAAYERLIGAGYTRHLPG